MLRMENPSDQWQKTEVMTGHKKGGKGSKNSMLQWNSRSKVGPQRRVREGACRPCQEAGLLV